MMLRSIVIITDGYVSVEPQVFDLIQDHLGQTNFFSFGIGSSVNRHLIEGIARVGLGEATIVKNKEEAIEKAKSFRQYIESPVLTNINVDYGDFDVYDVYPQHVPDVLANRPIVISGKYRGQPLGNIKIEGISGSDLFKVDYKVNRFEPSSKSSAIKYFWARRKIKLLGDYNLLRQSDRRIEMITEIGLQYNLLSAYTSFVAIEESIATANPGSTRRVTQKLPIPQCVSAAAVGFDLNISQKNRRKNKSFPWKVKLRSDQSQGQLH